MRFLDVAFLEYFLLKTTPILEWSKPFNFLFKAKKEPLKNGLKPRSVNDTFSRYLGFIIKQ